MSQNNNKNLQNFELTYFPFMCIRFITISVVSFGLRFAYKENGFRNKLIIAMLLFLILGLLMDTAKRTVEIVHAMNNPDQEDIYEWQDDLIKVILISTDYCINSVALLLNLGVWIVYLLKIQFMAGCKNDIERVDYHIEKLRKCTIISNGMIFTCITIVIFEVIYVNIKYYRDDNLMRN